MVFIDADFNYVKLRHVPNVSNTCSTLCSIPTKHERLYLMEKIRWYLILNFEWLRLWYRDMFLL